MPKVWNKRDPNCPNDAIYVGRPTKWGNPWSHLPSTKAAYKVNTREEAIKKYTEWLIEQKPYTYEDYQELRGKDLVCWCAPKHCHADYLLAIVNHVKLEPPIHVTEDLKCPKCGEDLSKWFVFIGCPKCNIPIEGFNYQRITNSIKELK